jgi:hypothetical protein
MFDVITLMHEAYKDDDDSTFEPVPDIDDTDADTLDCYDGDEVELSKGDKWMTHNVQKPKREPNGLFRGQRI